VEHNLTVSKDNLEPGDLVFWSFEENGRFMNITHVGIYAGNGKVIDASSTHDAVMYRDLYYAEQQVLYGRPIE
jgi:cell wall-associated NlpC family hydrolase